MNDAIIKDAKRRYAALPEETRRELRLEFNGASVTAAFILAELINPLGDTTGVGRRILLQVRDCLQCPDIYAERFTTDDTAAVVNHWRGKH